MTFDKKSLNKYLLKIPVVLPFPQRVHEGKSSDDS